MGFMQKQVTGIQSWIEIDGMNGITFVPRELVNVESDADGTITDFEALSDYYEGGEKRIYSASIRLGFGARLSAPGYMDCTEWSVFDTEQEASEYLADTYDDDDDDSQGGN